MHGSPYYPGSHAWLQEVERWKLNTDPDEALKFGVELDSEKFPSFS